MTEPGAPSDLQDFLNAVDMQGMTLLHVACASGRAEITKLLLARGADPNVESRAGYLPIDLVRCAMTPTWMTL